jgi:hypothetical protein
MLSIPKLDSLTYVSNLGGTTGTKLYKNASNKKWVVKRGEKGGGEKQIFYEFAANYAYKFFKIPVPNFMYDESSKSLILQYIDGKLLSDTTPDEFLAAKESLKKVFVVDALLANWDVIGYGQDNIILPSDNSLPVRIDNGGSFMFRAQGKLKPFTPIVHELDTMRDPSINPQAAYIFGELTDTEIDDQIKTIILPYYTIILEFAKVIFKNYLDVAEIFKQRLDFLVNKIGFYNTDTKSFQNVTHANKDKVDIANRSNKSNKNKGKQTFAKINQSNLNGIKNRFEQHPNLQIQNITSNNVKKLHEFGNTQKTFAPQLKKEDLSEFEYLLLKWYTGDNGPSELNPYLYSSDKNMPETLKNFINMAYDEKIVILEYLTKKYKRQPTETIEEYNLRILYYFAVNLYNLLGKSLRAKIPFKVFRGSRIPHLIDDSKNFYYLNSFTSTSLDADIAKSFGSLIYIFYVHPFCMYSDISQLSKSPHEQEILFTPYNRYKYISGFMVKHFVVFPTDLDLPKDYETFKVFKQNIKYLSKKIKGGSNNNKRNNNSNIYKKLNNTRRKYRNSNLNLWNIEDPTMSANNTSSFNTNSNSSNNNPTIPNNNTTRRNNKTNTTNSQQRSILSRFEEPIHSFPGKPPTPEEREIINQMIKYFNIPTNNSTTAES